MKLCLLLLSVISVVSASISSKLWPQATIYYRYDSSITEKLQQAIEEAMAIWSNATCLRFEESNSSDDYVLFYSFPNEEYCASDTIGRKGGQQRAILGYSCHSIGSILYTLGQIFGLIAENNRPDRDGYIRILYDNIEEGQEDNFEIGDLTIGYQGVSYDFASIMHFSALAYSQNGKDTIEITNYTAQGYPNLGNRLNLTERDITKVNRLYSCPGTGLCEDLSVNVESVQDLVTEYAVRYQVEVIAVDSEGGTQNLSSHPKTLSPGDTSLFWNESLDFPINREKWQFFRIAVSSEEHFQSMVETVSLKEGRFTALHTAGLNFGYECLLDSNDCDPNPCVAATQCNDELFDYTCDCNVGFGGKSCNIQCQHGYTGRNCSIDNSGDSCSPNPCVHAESCTDRFFTYTCNCRSGYGGDNCEIQCPLGFSGRNCGEDISGDSCASSPCHAQQSIGCVDMVYDYNCLCVPGFGGKNCEIRCRYGYGGLNCDVDVSGNSCLSSPCHAVNSLSCEDGFFDYTCNCRTGYGGKNCIWECPRGFDGRNCDIDRSGDSCAPNPCYGPNTRQCIDGVYSYRCECYTGYGGETCSIDLCPAGTCNNNGGSCVPSPPSYECVCPLAWTPASHCTAWEPRCLRVVIKRARGLSDRDGWFKGDSDPYTVISAYTASGYRENGRTSYRQGDESPVWNHNFDATCGLQWERFEFQVFDSDWGSDDALSHVQTVNINSLSSLPKCDLTISIVGGSGSITFDVYYYNQGEMGAPGSC